MVCILFSSVQCHHFKHLKTSNTQKNHTRILRKLNSYRYKATYKSSEKDPRRFIVICDVDRERQKPTKCPAHCVTLDMDTDLTDTFPPDKSVSTSMIDAWLDHNVMPAVTADVLLQVVFVRLCSKPEDTSHVMACLSKMTSLIRTVLMDPSLIRWKGRLSCDRFVLTIGKVAKTSRT